MLCVSNHGGQQAQADHVTHEGWLLKAGGADATKAKQRRFFVLRGSVRPPAVLLA